MLLKNIKAVAACAIMLLGAPAFANVVVHLNEKFASGAEYHGDLTFADNFTGLLSANGLLSGGSYGAGLAMNHVFSGLGAAATNKTNVADRLDDWLADGPDQTLTTVIGLVWAYPSSQLVLDLTASNPVWDTAIFGTTYFTGITVFHEGTLVSSDAARSYTLGAEPPPTNNPIPEPGSVLLLGAGIAALVGMRRRKAA
jgi:hypothetical protein